MALEALKQAEKHTVSVKQTEKAVARQVAAVVYIASDADESLPAADATVSGKFSTG